MTLYTLIDERQPENRVYGSNQERMVPRESLSCINLDENRRQLIVPLAFFDLKDAFKMSGFLNRRIPSMDLKPRFVTFECESRYRCDDYNNISLSNKEASRSNSIILIEGFHKQRDLGFKDVYEFTDAIHKIIYGKTWSYSSTTDMLGKKIQEQFRKLKGIFG